MNNPPPEHGLTLTLSWGAPGSPRRVLSLGAAARVAAALALCFVCYETGRWHGGLEAQVERIPVRGAAAGRAARALPVSEPAAGAVAPGQAVGEAPAVITPLNVRDPSALVIAPQAAAPAQEVQPQSDEPSVAPPARVFPRPGKDVKPSNRF